MVSLSYFIFSVLRKAATVIIKLNILVPQFSHGLKSLMAIAW